MMRRKLQIAITITSSLVWLILPQAVTFAETTNQISQFGITWTFDRDYQVGQFANGDYWVLDDGTGVKITNISPGVDVYNGYDVHGSEKNPVAGNMIQGYDEQFGRYDVLKNVGLNLPITLYTTDSLVSSISNTPPATHNGGQKTVMKTAAVLSCLGAVPPEGTFRPSYTDRTHTTLYNTNQLNWSLLASLPTSGAPSISDVERSFERVWLDHWRGWSAVYYHPLDNMYNYGREIASTAGIGALMLHTNLSQAQKETLLIRYVQVGIDLYGILKNGGNHNWLGEAGHGQGRKWPIIFAGLMLDDTGMKGIGTDGEDYYFGMDMETFYVSQADVDLTNGPTWNPDERSGIPYPYTTNMIGMPEWGIRYYTNPEQSDAAWYAIYRRCCTAIAWQGHILSALIMGAKDLWNHDALFDYMDRYTAITNGDPDPFGYTVPGETTGWHPGGWVGDMWDTYRIEYSSTPHAVISASPTSGESPLTVSFDGSASFDPDGTIVSYEWDFGDGVTSQEKEPSHTYTSAGEYTVTLTVTDVQGYKGQAQTHIVVLEKEKEFGELPTGCYNNVFNPTKGEKALIIVELPKQARVKLGLYNTRGKKIKQLADEEKEAGTHKYYWDGRNESDNVVGSGLYFVHIQAGDYKKTKKIVVVK